MWWGSWSKTLKIAILINDDLAPDYLPNQLTLGCAIAISSKQRCDTNKDMLSSDSSMQLGYNSPWHFFQISSMSIYQKLLGKYALAFSNLYLSKAMPIFGQITLTHINDVPKHIVSIFAITYLISRWIFPSIRISYTWSYCIP